MEGVVMARTFTRFAGAVILAMFSDLSGAAWGQQPRVLQVKASTVWIKVTSDEGVAAGSGFFVSNGIVVTNAHVLGMLGASAKPPSKVEVIINSGTPNEESVPDCKILGVDRTADLAVLKVESKTLPRALALNAAAPLFELQKVYVFGFPEPSKVGGKEMTVNESAVSSLRHDSKGALDRIQLNGGLHHGNSGGPIVNGVGEVIGVAVSGIRDTNINFAIPAAKVLETLRGRVLETEAGILFKQGDEVRVPIRYKCLDPMKKIEGLKVEVWVGNKNERRAYAAAKAQPYAGDGPRQSYTLKYADDYATGEILLPKVASGQVAWVQPVLTYGKAAAARWGPPTSYDPALAVERRPASFVHRINDKKQRTVHMKSQESFTVTVGSDSFVFNHSVELDLLEAIMSNPKGGAIIRTGFESPKLAEIRQNKKVTVDADVPELLQKWAPIFVVDATNRIRKRLDVGADVKLQTNKLDDFLNYFGLICFGMQTTNFALPNKEVQARDTWQSRTPYSPRRNGVAYKNDREIIATCTFEGWRKRVDKTEAMVSFTGQVKSLGKQKKDEGGDGTITGQFTFDPDLGYITWVNLAMSPELPEEVVGNLAVSISVELTRAEGNSKNLEVVDVKKALLDEAGTLTIGDVQPMFGNLAKVTIEHENIVAIKSAKDGDKKIVGNVPEWFQERSLHFSKQKDGVTKFSVERDGVVLMAVSPRFRFGADSMVAPGSGVFSKVRQPWFYDCKSKADLLSDGWQESGTVPILNSNWPVYYRDCRFGEKFQVQTERELAPIIFK